MPGGIAGYPVVYAGTDYGGDTTTSLGAPIVTGATNTKGSWVQLGVPTLYDIFLVQVYATILNNIAIILDVGIGAAGSQIEIISNVYMNANNTSLQQNGCLCLPISIPAGTTLWARAQSSSATQTIYVKLNGYAGIWEGCAGAEGFGVTLGSTIATTVTASATPFTKGNYAQLVASSAHAYTGLVASIFVNAGTPYRFFVDIAVGGAGSEQVIIPNIQTSLNDNLTSFVPVRIPAGTRISARCQNSAAGNLRVAMIGVF